MLWSLALLAPFSLLMSDLPRTWAWVLAFTVAARGIFDAVRHRAQRPVALVIPIGRGQLTCDGQPIPSFAIEWRGPLAFLRWRHRNGRTQRVVFWPDTLPSASRRELRLAAMRIEPAREAASMAR